MTVPVERTRAVVSTEEFLKELLDCGKTPRVPKYIRQRASLLLRHYPTEFDMEMISRREDGDDPLKLPKIFGRGYS